MTLNPICPVLSSTKIIPVECKREDCAWYYASDKICTMLCIARELKFIGSVAVDTCEAIKENEDNE